MATRQAPKSDAPASPPEHDSGAARSPIVEDIRAGKPYLLSRSPLRVFGRRVASIASLVLLDLCGLILGVYAALVVRDLYYGEDPILWGVLWKAETDWLPFLALVIVLVFWQAGLYAERERRAGVGRIVAPLALVGLITLAFGLGIDQRFSTYGLIPTAFVLTACFIGLLRASYEVVTEEALRLAGVLRRAVLVGEGESLSRLRRVLGSNRAGIDYEFVGAVGAEPAPDGVPLLGSLEALPAVLAANQVDELIVADNDFSERQLLEIVEQAHRRGVKVRMAPKTTELLTQRGEYVPGQGMPLFELRPPAFAGTDWVLKRTFDLVVSLAAVVVGLPIWIAIALAVKLSSRGPVFYRDLRVGLGEREFSMFKFRTMYRDADERQPGLEAANEASGPLFKIRRDPRVTPVGALLRRFSLDEVPQVLNVLRGEMSLVGPRPLPIRDFERLEPWHRKRYLVLPGMTGLWQIAGRSELDFDDLVRLDFYYLENWSVWLDVTILLKTVPAVLGARGAY